MRDIPVIVISALDEIDSAVRCIEMGAEDYLPKSFNPVLLRARLNASLQKKKLRDLEKAYLQQEVMLRQSEKLATLGKLSAGMAHELNNPAAAAQRGAAQLHSRTSPASSRAHLKLGALDLSHAAAGGAAGLGRRADAQAVGEPTRLFRRLDRAHPQRPEAELEAWLASIGVSNCLGGRAHTLVSLGFDR